MDGRMVFWITIYSFAIYIKVSQAEYQGCREQSLVGINKLDIPDTSYTASSYFDDRYLPHDAKLYGNYGWAPKNSKNRDEYLQIDLGTPRVITAVATQGNGGNPNSNHYKDIYEWVKSYNMSFANNKTSWIRYKHKVTGNTDGKSVVRYDLKPPITAQYIRFIPLKYQAAKAMRVNVYVFSKLQVIVVPGPRSIRLTWTIKPCSLLNITGYTIRLNGDQDFKVNSSERKWQLKGLKTYTEYSVSVKAETQEGDEIWSNVERTRTCIEKPTAAPNIISIKAASSNSITIKLKKPAHDKINGPFLRYEITYTPQGRMTDTPSRIKFVKDVTTFNLTSLCKYTNYSITIAVRNTKYIGPPSKERKVRTMEDAPSAPVNLNSLFKPANGLVRPRVVITWGRPLKANGIIRNYTIIYYYNNMNTSNKVIVTNKEGTTNSLKYTVTVMCSGTFSYSIRATTIKDGPYASGKRITIPEYRCPEQSLVAGKEKNINVPNSSYTSSSDYGALYKPYNAKLHGKYGWAARDNKNPDEYLQIDLGTPRVITAVATQGNGNTKEWVKTYLVYLATNKKNQSHNYTDEFGNVKLFKGNTDSNSIVRHDLMNPQLARYITFVPVEYHNHKTMRVNVYVTKQEPPRLTPVPKNRTINLTWTYRKCSPTDYITGYVVKVGNRTHDVIGDDQSFTVTNLKPYTEYNVSIKATKQIGYGIWSNVTTIKTTIAVPESIPSLNATETSSEAILLKWKLQTSELIHGPFKGYRITYTPQGGKTKILDVGNVTTYTLTSLLKYTNYDITIAVSNTKYIGPPKERTVRTMEDAPSAPVNVTGTLMPSHDSGGPRVVIKWNRPRDPNGIIRKYTIVYYYNMDTSNNKTVTINGTSDLRYITNITGNGTLSYKISATTIKEGPYQSGDNITIPLHFKSRRNAEEESQFPFHRLLIAGIVAGFIVLLLVLIVVITSWKRRHRNQKRKHEVMVMDPVPQSASLAVMVDAPASEDNHDYDNILDMSPKRFLDIENNIEDNTYEETEIPVPDLMPVQNLVEFIPPDNSKLTEEFKSIPVEPRHESKMAKRPVNKIKNRYKNIVAYDHSLVALEQDNDDPDSCYINASFIRGYEGTPAAYIATQGPLNTTLDDFWRMIWDHDVSSIIMLTNLLELGKRKCHQYWPDNNSTRYADITVINHKTEVFADFVIRTLFLTKADMPKRKVFHFHFTAWPDKGVPDHATSALAFRRKVLALSSEDNRPMVIHCSAGVGRTGTYIMIDAMLRQAQTDQQTMDIAGYLHAIRDDRPYMVQTLEQYIFVSMAVHEALSCGNTEIQAHNLRIIMQQLSTVDKRHKLTGFALEFQRLEAVTSQNTQEHFAVGLKKENMRKNRYSNIVTTNESRVILSTDEADNEADYVNASAIDLEDVGKGDYINASFVHTYREHNAFIMTQAPMENTIADFWRMVMDYEIGTIVMLNNLEEECESFPQYWPKHGTNTYGDVTVKLVETKDMGNIIARQFEVKKQGTRRTVCHLQNFTWENKCIPADPQTVLNLNDEVQKSQQKSGNSPIVVQCSNGVGRSGTFCAISSCLERVKQEQVLDVFQTIKSIRVNRPGAVETLTQYVFCYNIIQKYLDSFSTYSNFGDVN